MAAARLTFQCLDIVKKRYVIAFCSTDYRKKERRFVVYSLGNNDLEKYPL